MSMLKSHSLTLSLSHTFLKLAKLAFTNSRHAEQLLFSCLCSQVTLSLSHSLIIPLSHSPTLSLSHSLTLSLSQCLTLTLSGEENNTQHTSMA